MKDACGPNFRLHTDAQPPPRSGARRPRAGEAARYASWSMTYGCT
jgi:hypothetical protein